MPFSIDTNFSCGVFETTRLALRPVEAAIMWQAVPERELAVFDSSLGPLVGRSHPGKEHRWPALSASACRIAGVKSALMLDLCSISAPSGQ